jgi:hypothetical protein
MQHGRCISFGYTAIEGDNITKGVRNYKYTDTDDGGCAKLIHPTLMSS